MRELLCDESAPLAVFSVSMAASGLFILIAGIETHADALVKIGLLALSTPAMIAWIMHDPDAPEIRPAAADGPGEIARMSDAEFDRLLDDVERQARMPALPPPPPAADIADDDEFPAMVAEALDELPEFVQDELRRGNLAVTISDWGSEWPALGLYCGGSIANADYVHAITIFRDTLTACYGDNTDELRRQVKITVRHEVAHHFGANERRVRELGL
jgi:predicted Zn-dependent protease with MMP-like domain